MSIPGTRDFHHGLLGANRTRRRLVVSTAQGRYNIGTSAVPWDPIRDFFRNQLTNIVRPMRSRFRDKSYGSGTKYIVTLTTDGGEEETIPIYQYDHEVRKFRGFQLTFESIQSREALEIFLLERAVAGDLRCSDLTVFDLEEWRSTVYEHYRRPVMDARLCGWFTYNVLGWLLTRWSDFTLRRRNRKNRQKNRESLDAKARSKELTGRVNSEALPEPALFRRNPIRRHASISPLRSSSADGPPGVEHRRRPCVRHTATTGLLP